MSTQKNNFTVENLVAKYRNYVNEHAPKIDCEDGSSFSNTFDSMETLLLSLYKSAAANKVDKYVLKALNDCAHLYEDYYYNAFSEEEYAFLVANFSKFVDCTIASYMDGRVISAPSRVELIKKYLSPKTGSSIFLANTGCDVACFFPDCNCEGYSCSDETPEIWAIGKILLFSKGINAQYQTSHFDETKGYSGISMPKEGTVDFLIYGAHEHITFNDIMALYRCVSPNGKMLIFVDKSEMQVKNETFCELRKTLVEEKAISSIIEYKDVDISSNTDVNRLLFVIDKSGSDVVNIESLSSNRKCSISVSSLNPDILWPGYYMTTRPENGIPLSKICKTISAKEDFKIFEELVGGKLRWEVSKKGERLVLPEWVLDLPIASQSDFASQYKDANICTKNLYLVSDPIVEDWRSQIRIVDKPCVLLSGGYGIQKRFVVGYFECISDKKYARMAALPCLWPQEGIDVRYLAAILLKPVVYEQILSICDEEILHRKNFNLILDMVMVPNHDEKERLKFLSEENYSAMDSIRKELEAKYENKLLEEKTKYINEVRMRKHDMGQYIFQLDNIQDMMRYYVGICEKEHNSCFEITNLLDNFRYSLKELSILLANLSKEEQFGEPERIDINKFLSQLSGLHDADRYKIEYTCDIPSIRRYNFSHYIDEYTINDFKTAFLDEKTYANNVSATKPSYLNSDKINDIDTNSGENYEILDINIEGSDNYEVIDMDNDDHFNVVDEIIDNTHIVERVPSMFVSSHDLQRAVNNILSNAMVHGFTDTNRKDYMVKILLSIDTDRNMIMIEFSNNGTPLPEGMNKMRYGLRGEKAGKTGGTGIGGNYVRLFTEHYGGDFDVFQDNGWTKVRVYLPIK